MATRNPAARSSRADKTGTVNAVTVSPFRSYAISRREQATLDMIDKRRTELRELQRRQAIETRPKHQRTLATRILATRNNLEAWRDYLDQGCAREPRAVIIP